MCVRNHCPNSPRETPACPHNPVQSLKVHLGRRRVTAAVFPSPSRFRLCAHFCSPQSLLVNKRNVLFPSDGSGASHITGQVPAGKKFAAWSKVKRRRNRCLQSPRMIQKKERETIQERRMEKAMQVLKNEINAKVKLNNNARHLHTERQWRTISKVGSMWLLKSSS